MNKDNLPSRAVEDRRRIARRGAGWLLGPMLGFLAGRASAPSDRDHELVQVTSATVDRGQDFWSRRVPGWRDARVVLIDRPTPTPCGIAGPTSGPFYCASDSKIYLDLGFLSAIHGDLARSYVVAHELAHHVQVLAADRSTGVARELGADCLAGLWMRDELDKGRVSEAELEDALELAASVGDDRVCAGCSPEEWRHGSAGARVAAVSLGASGGPCSAWSR